MKKSDFIKKIERAQRYSDKSSQLVDEIIDELKGDISKGEKGIE